MTAIRTQIVVEKCADCPFYERTIAHVLVEMIAKQPRARGGLCKYNGLGQGLLVGRLYIADEAAIPEVCPLRAGDVVVQLGRGRP